MRMVCLCKRCHNPAIALQGIISRAGREKILGFRQTRLGRTMGVIACKAREKMNESLGLGE